MARKSRTGKWQTPLSLPETINQGSEKGPRIMPDNVTLIYSSEAGESKNFNLYFSVLNIKNQWSKPLPIPELNTDQSDMFVSILKDESSLYYCNEEEKNVDIFQYKPVPPYLRFVKSFVVEGTIRDENTKEPIKAQIQFLLEDDPNFKLAELQTTVSSGKFKLKLREDYAYRYVVAAKGYEALSNTIVLAKAEKDLMVQRLDIVLKPDAQLMASQEERNKDIFSVRNEEYDKNNPNRKNRLPDSLLFYDRDLKDNEDDTALATALLDQKKTIVFESIRFATASADLQTPAFPVLDEIFVLLQKYPTIHFQILAHTDDVGKDENNFLLSDRRAASVIQYLTDKGISPLRLEPKGLGETQPIVPNDSDENRAINRRVEFKVIE
jgi:outer membrane protein OmpA-like peptidoglycan-associated protein